MAERRVRVPKDKAELVKRLRYVEDENENGVFENYAHVLVFSAMLGYKNERFVLPTSFDNVIDPIRFDVFERAGYDRVFYLLSLVHSNDPETLAQTEESYMSRIEVFEAYANGGLEILAEKLYGRDDPLDFLLLMLGQGREIA